MREQQSGLPYCLPAGIRSAQWQKNNAQPAGLSIWLQWLILWRDCRPWPCAGNQKPEWLIA
jgi:hypothetical protein